MFEIVRLVNVTLNTKDINKMLDYYTRVIGMYHIETDKDMNRYLSFGVDHHNLTLKPTKSNFGFQSFSFEIATDYSIKNIIQYFHDNNIAAHIKYNEEYNIPELIELSDLDGHLIHLYLESPKTSIDYKNEGISPNKLGHIAFTVGDVAQTVEFYETFLGFKVSDWMDDFFCFMRCNQDHHTVNFIESKKTQKMHHLAFELKDSAHIITSNDMLYKHNKPLIWGPVRHGIGHNISTYHNDPEENKIELFTELDIINDKHGAFEPRLVHDNNPQKPKVWKNTDDAANLWGTPPPEGFMD